MKTNLYIAASSPQSATVSSKELKLEADINLDYVTINLRSMTMVLLPQDLRAMEIITELAKQIRFEAGILDD